ncbi:MAG: hypothetical protein QOJ50_2996, partial [Cryptosporangiaceae bacterium]|nr:hypothetical protein [Cryptosporangiaceae bacterium]
MDIEERLAAAAGAVREVELLTGRLAELGKRIAAAEEIVNQRATDLVEEDRDVRRLDGVSFSRIVAAVRRSRDSDLERERAERDIASYRLDEACDALADLERDRDAVTARLDGLAGARAEWRAALAAKESQLTGPAAAELADIAAERGRITRDRTEIAEALRAAAAAEDALARADASLASAGGWSTYDTFLGGEGLSSMVKQDHMADAQRHAAAAQARLVTLAAELGDVPGAGRITAELNLDGLTSFADIFFDNIFTDLAIDGRIRRAREQTDAVRREVAAVVARLRSRSAQGDTRLTELGRRRVALLA